MGRGREAETLRGEEGRKRRAGTRALSGDGGGDARASREGGGARNTLGPVPPASPSPPGSGRSRRNPSQGCDPAPPRSARRCLREPRRLAHLRGFTSPACEPGEKDHGPPVGVCVAPPHPVLCGLSPTTQRPPHTHTHKTHRAVAGGSGRVLPATGFRQKPGRGSGGVVVTT